MCEEKTYGRGTAELCNTISLKLKKGIAEVMSCFSLRFAVWNSVGEAVQLFSPLLIRARSLKQFSVIARREAANQPRKPFVTQGEAKQSAINCHSEGNELFVPEDSKHNNVTERHETTKQSTKAFVTQGEAKQSRKAAFSLAEAMKRFFTEKSSENCLAYCSEQKFLCETAAMVSSSKRSLPMNLGLSLETTSERKSSKASFLGTFWRNKKCHKTEKSFKENSRRKPHITQNEAKQSAINCHSEGDFPFVPEESKHNNVIERREAAKQSTNPPVTQSEAQQSRKAAFSLAEAMKRFFTEKNSENCLAYCSEQKFLCETAAKVSSSKRSLPMNLGLSIETTSERKSSKASFLGTFWRNKKCHKTEKSFKENSRRKPHITQSEAKQSKKAAFSLAEAMITLLMVSIILSALAPIMSKKMRLTQTGFSTDGGYKYKQELTTIGSGTWSVPSGLQELAVTIIGGGGGGGAGLSMGEKEWTTPGTYNWTVPNGVTEIEATLVSGGAGGGAGNVIVNSSQWTNLGHNSWTPPAVAMGQTLRVLICGAGGGAGGLGAGSAGVGAGGGGGRGGYTLTAFTPTGYSYIDIFLGSGGGGGGAAGVAGACPRAGTGGGCGGYGAYGTCSWNWGGAGGDQLGVPSNGGGSLNNAYNGLNNSSPGSYGGNYGGWGKCNTIGCSNACGGGGGAGSSWIAGGGGGGQDWGNGGGGGGGIAWLRWRSASDGVLYQVKANGGGGGGGGGEYGNRAGGGGGGGAGAGLIDSTIGGNGGNADYYWGGAGGAGQDIGGGASYSGEVPSGYCAGAPQNVIPNSSGTSGKSAFAKISYADIGNGASGGGGGAIVPSQKVKVTPGETLTIIVGAGGTGGTAGAINSSGSIVNPTNGAFASPSVLKRGGTLILHTNNNSTTTAWGGPVGGVYSGRSVTHSGTSGTEASYGWITNGLLSPQTYPPPMWGANTTAGGSAGNLRPNQPGPFANGTVGGDGGVTSIDGANFDYSKLPSGWCKVAKGGTSSSRNGQSASGFGGCGGGGGYGLGAGGNGAGGYARIRWNRNQQGAGGGGGSSNVIYRKLINIQSATGTIPYIIGDGGIGGGTTFSTSTYRFNDGGQGEATSFGAGAAKLEVKGGLGGQSSYSTTAGTTGDAVTTTYYGGAGGALLDKSQCLFGSTITICYGSAAGTAGTNTNTSVGGIGASLEYKNTVYGKGGSGSSTGDGQAGDLFGSGGGGGGVKADTNTKGGKGAPGKIILEWK